MISCILRGEERRNEVCIQTNKHTKIYVEAKELAAFECLLTPQENKQNIFKYNEIFTLIIHLCIIIKTAHNK